MLVVKPEGKTGWNGPYFKPNFNEGLPLDPDPWGHAYIYVCPGRNNINGYDLFSVGPDGKAGTKDDITNWGKPELTSRR